MTIFCKMNSYSLSSYSMFSFLLSHNVNTSGENVIMSKPFVKYVIRIMNVDMPIFGMSTSAIITKLLQVLFLLKL